MDTNDRDTLLLRQIHHYAGSAPNAAVIVIHRYQAAVPFIAVPHVGFCPDCDILGTVRPQGCRPLLALLVPLCITVLVRIAAVLERH